MRRLIAIGALALALSACGEGETSATTGQEPTSPSSPTELAYVESAQCREDAQPVLDIVALALTDEDVRDVAGRLATVEEMTPAAIAHCTGAVVRPVSEAIDSLTDAVDNAISGRGSVIAPFKTARERLDDAQVALDATG